MGIFKACMTAVAMTVAASGVQADPADPVTPITVTSSLSAGLSDPVVVSGASGGGMVMGPISPLTGSPVPPGYKVAWTDGRLNPLRGPRP